MPLTEQRDDHGGNGGDGIGDGRPGPSDCDDDDNGGYGHDESDDGDDATTDSEDGAAALLVQLVLMMMMMMIEKSYHLWVELGETEEGI